MSTRLRLLLVEDSDDDAALVLRQLSEGGYEVTVKRVETAGGLSAALAEQEWDVALIDYIMPQFSGVEALRLLREKRMDLPRIMISGAMGEEAAADVMRCGAHDLILKGNLGRLVPVVERELRDAEGRRKRRRAEEALERSRRELGIWNRIADIFLTVPDEEMYGQVLEVILEALDSEQGIFGYVDERGDLICPAMNRDAGREYDTREGPVVFARAKWRGIWSHALTARAVFSPDDALSGRESIPLRAPIAAPIMHEGEVIGILEVASKQTDYTDADRELLEAIAGRIAPVLHARLQRNREEIQRRQAHEDLAAERERLAVTLRSIGDGVIATDTDGCVALVSKLAERLTGWPQARARGKALTEVFGIVHAETHEACADPVRQVLDSGEMVNLPRDAALLSADGIARPIAGTLAPVRDAESEIVGMVVVFRDMSEKRRMDEALLRASKLESLTLLAGGIGHDFNNILTALMGNISLARRQADPNDGVFHRLVGAEKACVQAKSLTQQLLTFAKGGAPARTTASLGELVTDCARFVVRGSPVRCDVSVSEDLWPVDVDQGQMSQVINNVIINAKEAMPSGGAIAVCAENVAVGKDDVPGLAAGAYVRVRVTDEGTGIPAADVPVIFDPYFTTKPEGSGLGLATAQSIVKTHDGEITLESKEGVGTTFALYLPASDSRAAAERHAEEAERRGRGRVLVMDDEETVRELTGDMLAHLGYEVDFAADGAEAIEAYSEAKKSGEPFDALVMDLTIPGAMGGREAIKRLREVDPEVKAVVSSGYATDSIMTDFSEHGFCACVAKPYRIEELGEALHRAIPGGGQ